MKTKLQLFCITFLFTFFSFAQPGTTCWRVVSAGNNFTLAIKSDGTLWGWGLNGNRLGLGFITTSENLPIQVGTANDWLDVSSGENHALALKTNGTLWAWGNGQFGQLGNGVFNSATFNVTQVGTANDWIDISAGTSFSLAIKSNNTLWSWGLNSTGQLGQNNLIDLNVPTQVGTATDWLKIDAGHQHALAIKTTNTLWSWGNNTNGQLGDGTNTTSLLPIMISTIPNWSEVSAGFDHSMAIDINFFLYTWGNNINGQLGNGNNTATNLPNQVSFNADGTPSLCIAISAGDTHSLIISSTNNLLSSGFNNQGQLGLGNFTNTNVFNQVGTSANWNMISAGFVHSHAVEFGLNLWSAGRGLEGQLGVGTNVNSNVLVLVNCPGLSNLEFDAQPLLSFFPNPTSDLLNIDFSNSLNFLNEPINMQLTNLQGQIVFEFENTIKSTPLHIDLSHQQIGIYLLKLNINNRIFTYKVLKK